MAIHYTRSEALLNTWSHAAGILLGAVTGTLLLMMCAGSDDGWAGTGVVLYLAGMLASYIASTLYHAMPECYCRLKERLRKLDHAAIYRHIAGSYSPLTLIALRHEGLWGWVLFVFIWSCALAGTMMSFRRLREHSNIETMCYIGMGISVLAAFRPLINSVSPAAVWWIVAEGVFYITGVLFYSLNKRRYMHSVFHFFVLAGSVCHIIAVWDVLMQYL